ncbi:MAG: hypothetical protein ACQESA_02965 [Patescibacteria group bacterium]
MKENEISPSFSWINVLVEERVCPNPNCGAKIKVKFNRKKEEVVQMCPSCWYVLEIPFEGDILIISK